MEDAGRSTAPAPKRTANGKGPVCRFCWESIGEGGACRARQRVERATERRTQNAGASSRCVQRRRHASRDRAAHDRMRYRSSPCAP
ncbi:hypothetical protein C7S16_0055 [Burkholderia thailandensis]|uniref:Uncharacterized protein n=1 Tax=Burkholderia thailandensis TaxID=57975 RepID=A0AAW9D6V5_BURTH|nr:hypothetical protein [Burkholderia thailandensis]MDW9257697.1 hypothetical protein [Burkholderia thailandensis]